MEDALPWVAALAGGLLLLGCIVLLGPAVGGFLFHGRTLHPLPVYAPEVIRKPAELGRFALAVLVVFVVAAVLLATPRLRDLRAFHSIRRVAPASILIGQLAAIAVLVWAWRGQNEGVNHLTPVQFHLDRLLVAVAIAAVVLVAVPRGWLARASARIGRRHSAAWAVLALLITGLWLAPALFRAANLAHSMAAVWYPLQFTLDDFLSVLDGRTPLVNYDTQYASLMPFATEPVFRLFGASVGTFTALMCTLSLAAFMCVERALAMIARDERTALLLYLPLLAVSLLTLRHGANQRYFMANYYEVMPIRYFGPYVLLWLLVRQLKGMRPGRPVVLFLVAGLIAINNTEFGIPALGGCLLALAAAQIVPRAGAAHRLRRLGGELALGLGIAIVGVIVFILLRSGTFPQFSRLTRYEQIYAITGFNLVPTPNAGLHVIIFMTFAAALIVAALRTRSAHPDRGMTGALIFAGTFGLGAGSYYMGRSLPEVLAAMLSAWGLAAALLCLVALQALRAAPTRARVRPALVLPITAAVVALALMATTIDQFPAPWAQWKRITQSSNTLLFDVGPSVRFVRSISRPRAHVALLTGLGHVIGRDADVVDVSPYSHPDGIVMYEQLDDVLAALPRGPGDTVFTGPVVPEIAQVLTARGFRVIAQDPSSSLTAWRRSGSHDA